MNPVRNNNFNYNHGSNYSKGISNGLQKKSIKRIVVKIGTSLLTTKKNRLDEARIGDMVSQILELLDQGVEVLLVTSGAIGAGMGLLNIKTRPQSLPKLQACAAVGQSHLMKIYDSFFKRNCRLTAQLLLTQEDLADRRRYLNAKNTLLTLLGEGIVPIINENDTVSTDEIKFGDNDRLSSLVANLVKADLLLLLSDVDGLYRYDSKGRRIGSHIEEVTKITDDIKNLALKSKSKQGIGGMASKIEAARICIDSGIHCIVANGTKKEVLIKAVKGQKVGTSFLPSQTRIAARKHWIAHSTKLCGSIIVDEGAVEALVRKNKSLLSSGIAGLEGNFDTGDVVSVMDKNNREFARGLTNYSSSEIEKIKGLKTGRIEQALGYKYYDEVIHRDNLVIL